MDWLMNILRKIRRADGNKQPEDITHIWEPDVDIMPPPLVEGEMPTYFHVGVFTKELLTHGFNIGAWQIMSTSKAKGDYILSSFGEGYPTAENVFGGCEVLKKIGSIQTSLSWLTTQEFVPELGVNGSSLGGVWYAILRSTIGTENGVHFRSKIKCGYERFPYKMELVLPLYREPHFMGYIVVSPIANWLLGYRSVYNLERMGFERHAFCVGLNNGTTEIGLKLENLQDLRGSIFRRFNETWACALKFNLYGSEETNQFAIGGQYDCRNGTLLKARFQEDATIWFAYQTKIGEKINVLFHLGFKVHDPFDGAHKIGLSWHSSC